MLNSNYIQCWSKKDSEWKPGQLHGRDEKGRAVVTIRVPDPNYPDLYCPWAGEPNVEHVPEEYPPSNDGHFIELDIFIYPRLIHAMDDLQLPPWHVDPDLTPPTFNPNLEARLERALRGNKKKRLKIESEQMAKLTAMQEKVEEREAARKQENKERLLKLLETDRTTAEERATRMAGLQTDLDEAKARFYAAVAAGCSDKERARLLADIDHKQKMLDEQKRRDRALEILKNCNAETLEEQARLLAEADLRAQERDDARRKANNEYLNNLTQTQAQIESERMEKLLRDKRELERMKAEFQRRVKEGNMSPQEKSRLLAEIGAKENAIADQEKQLKFEYDERMIDAGIAEDHQGMTATERVAAQHDDEARKQQMNNLKFMTKEEAVEEEKFEAERTQAHKELEDLKAEYYKRVAAGDLTEKEKEQMLKQIEKKQFAVDEIERESRFRAKKKEAIVEERKKIAAAQVVREKKDVARAQRQTEAFKAISKDEAVKVSAQTRNIAKKQDELAQLKQEYLAKLAAGDLTEAEKEAYLSKIDSKQAEVDSAERTMEFEADRQAAIARGDTEAVARIDREERAAAAKDADRRQNQRNRYENLTQEEARDEAVKVEALNQENQELAKLKQEYLDKLAAGKLTEAEKEEYLAKIEETQVARDTVERAQNFKADEEAAWQASDQRKAIEELTTQEAVVDHGKRKEEIEYLRSLGAEEAREELLIDGTIQAQREELSVLKEEYYDKVGKTGVSDFAKAEIAAQEQRRGQTDQRRAAEQTDRFKNLTTQEARQESSKQRDLSSKQAELAALKDEYLRKLAAGDLTEAEKAKYLSKIDQAQERVDDAEREMEFEADRNVAQQRVDAGRRRQATDERRAAEQTDRFKNMSKADAKQESSAQRNLAAKQDELAALKDEYLRKLAAGDLTEAEKQAYLSKIDNAQEAVDNAERTMEFEQDRKAAIARGDTAALARIDAAEKEDARQDQQRRQEQRKRYEGMSAAEAGAERDRVADMNRQNQELARLKQEYLDKLASGKLTDAEKQEYLAKIEQKTLVRDRVERDQKAQDDRQAVTRINQAERQDKMKDDERRAQQRERYQDMTADEAMAEQTRVAEMDAQNQELAKLKQEYLDKLAAGKLTEAEKEEYLAKIEEVQAARDTVERTQKQQDDTRAAEASAFLGEDAQKQLAAEKHERQELDVRRAEDQTERLANLTKEEAQEEAAGVADLSKQQDELARLKQEYLAKLAAGDLTEADKKEYLQKIDAQQSKVDAAERSLEYEADRKAAVAGKEERRQVDEKRAKQQTEKLANLSKEEAVVESAAQRDLARQQDELARLKEEYLRKLAAGDLTEAEKQEYLSKIDQAQEAVDNQERTMEFEADRQAAIARGDTEAVARIDAAERADERKDAERRQAQRQKYEGMSAQDAQAERDRVADMNRQNQELARLKQEYLDKLAAGTLTDAEKQEYLAKIEKKTVARDQVERAQKFEDDNQQAARVERRAATKDAERRQAQQEQYSNFTAEEATKEASRVDQLNQENQELARLKQEYLDKLAAGTLTEADKVELLAKIEKKQEKRDTVEREALAKVDEYIATEAAKEQILDSIEQKQKELDEAVRDEKFREERKMVEKGIIKDDMTKIAEAERKEAADDSRARQQQKEHLSDMTAVEAKEAAATQAKIDTMDQEILDVKAEYLAKVASGDITEAEKQEYLKKIAELEKTRDDVKREAKFEEVRKDALQQNMQKAAAKVAEADKIQEATDDRRAAEQTKVMKNMSKEDAKQAATVNADLAKQQDELARLKQEYLEKLASGDLTQAEKQEYLKKIDAKQAQVDTAERAVEFDADRKAAIARGDTAALKKIDAAEKVQAEKDEERRAEQRERYENLTEKEAMQEAIKVVEMNKQDQELAKLKQEYLEKVASGKITEAEKAQLLSKIEEKQKVHDTVERAQDKEKDQIMEEKKGAKEVLAAIEAEEQREAATDLATREAEKEKYENLTAKEAEVEGMRVAREKQQLEEIAKLKQEYYEKLAAGKDKLKDVKVEETMNEDGTKSAFVTLPIDYNKNCGTPEKKAVFLGKIEGNINRHLAGVGFNDRITCPTAAAGSVILEIRGNEAAVDAAVQAVKDGLIKVPGVEYGMTEKEKSRLLNAIDKKTAAKDEESRKAKFDDQRKAAAVATQQAQRDKIAKEEATMKATDDRRRDDQTDRYKNMTKEEAQVEAKKVEELAKAQKELTDLKQEYYKKLAAGNLSEKEKARLLAQIEKKQTAVDNIERTMQSQADFEAAHKKNVEEVAKKIAAEEAVAAATDDRRAAQQETSMKKIDAEEAKEAAEEQAVLAKQQQELADLKAEYLAKLAAGDLTEADKEAYLAKIDQAQNAVDNQERQMEFAADRKAAVAASAVKITAAKEKVAAEKQAQQQKDEVRAAEQTDRLANLTKEEATTEAQATAEIAKQQDELAQLKKEYLEKLAAGDLTEAEKQEYLQKIDAKQAVVDASERKLEAEADRKVAVATEQKRAATDERRAKQQTEKLANLSKEEAVVESAAMAEIARQQAELAALKEEYLKKLAAGDLTEKEKEEYLAKIDAKQEQVDAVERKAEFEADRKAAIARGDTEAVAKIDAAERSAEKKDAERRAEQKQKYAGMSAEDAAAERERVADLDRQNQELAKLKQEYLDKLAAGTLTQAEKEEYLAKIEEKTVTRDKVERTQKVEDDLRAAAVVEQRAATKDAERREQQREKYENFTADQAKEEATKVDELNQENQELARLKAEYLAKLASGDMTAAEKTELLAKIEEKQVSRDRVERTIKAQADEEAAVAEITKDAFAKIDAREKESASKDAERRVNQRERYENMTEQEAKVEAAKIEKMNQENQQLAAAKQEFYEKAAGAHESAVKKEAAVAEERTRKATDERRAKEETARLGGLTKTEARQESQAERDLARQQAELAALKDEYLRKLAAGDLTEAEKQEYLQKIDAVQKNVDDAERTKEFAADRQRAQDRVDAGKQRQAVDERRAKEQTDRLANMSKAEAQQESGQARDLARKQDELARLKDEYLKKLAAGDLTEADKAAYLSKIDNAQKAVDDQERKIEFEADRKAAIASGDMDAVARIDAAEKEDERRDAQRRADQRQRYDGMSAADAQAERERVKEMNRQNQELARLKQEYLDKLASGNLTQAEKAKLLSQIEQKTVKRDAVERQQKMQDDARAVARVDAAERQDARKDAERRVAQKKRYEGMSTQDAEAERARVAEMDRQNQELAKLKQEYLDKLAAGTLTDADKQAYLKKIEAKTMQRDQVERAQKREDDISAAKVSNFLSADAEQAIAAKEQKRAATDTRRAAEQTDQLRNLTKEEAKDVSAAAAEMARQQDELARLKEEYLAKLASGDLTEAEKKEYLQKIDAAQERVDNTERKLEFEADRKAAIARGDTAAIARIDAAEKEDARQDAVRRQAQRQKYEDFTEAEAQQEIEKVRDLNAEDQELARLKQEYLDKLASGKLTETEKEEYLAKIQEKQIGRDQVERTMKRDDDEAAAIAAEKQRLLNQISGLQETRDAEERAQNFSADQRAAVKAADKEAFEEIAAAEKADAARDGERRQEQKKHLSGLTGEEAANEAEATERLNKLDQELAAMKKEYAEKLASGNLTEKEKSRLLAQIEHKQGQRDDEARAQAIRSDVRGAEQQAREGVKSRIAADELRQAEADYNARQGDKKRMKNLTKEEAATELEQEDKIANLDDELAALKSEYYAKVAAGDITEEEKARLLAQIQSKEGERDQEVRKQKFEKAKERARAAGDTEGLARIEQEERMAEEADAARTHQEVERMRNVTKEDAKKAYVQNEEMRKRAKDIHAMKKAYLQKAAGQPLKDVAVKEEMNADGTKSAFVTLPLDYNKTCGTPAKKAQFLGEFEGNVNDHLAKEGFRNIACPTAAAGSVIVEIRGPTDAVDEAVQAVKNGLIKVPGIEYGMTDKEKDRLLDMISHEQAKQDDQKRKEVSRQRLKGAQQAEQDRINEIYSGINEGITEKEKRRRLEQAEYAQKQLDTDKEVQKLREEKKRAVATVGGGTGIDPARALGPFPSDPEAQRRWLFAHKEEMLRRMAEKKAALLAQRAKKKKSKFADWWKHPIAYWPLNPTHCATSGRKLGKTRPPKDKPEDRDGDGIDDRTGRKIEEEEVFDSQGNVVLTLDQKTQDLKDESAQAKKDAEHNRQLDEKELVARARNYRPTKAELASAVDVNAMTAQERREWLALSPEERASRESQMAAQKMLKRERLKQRKARSIPDSSVTYTPPGHVPLSDKQLYIALIQDGPALIYSNEKHEWLEATFLEYEPGSNIYRVQMKTGRLVTCPRTRIKPTDDDEMLREGETEMQFITRQKDSVF